MKRFALFVLVLCMIEFTISVYNEWNTIYWLILCLVNAVCVWALFALDKYI